MSRRTLIFTVLALSLIFGLPGCSSEVKEPTVPTYKTSLSKDEQRNSAFGKEFPQQWTLYQRNTQANELEAAKTMTMFKGSVPFLKNDDVNPLPKGFKQAAQPYLKNLWLGYPFSFEYNEARGHTYAIEDFVHIDRINRYDEKGGLPATCWNCKTAKVTVWQKEFGDDKFWSMDVNTFRTPQRVHEKDDTIGCANCHDPQNMELSLYSIPLKDYLKRAGKDFSTMSRNEKRALVCAQCHVEYYFSEPEHGPNKKPVFPWDNGFDPEQMYNYYNDKGKKQEDGSFGKFADWVHPVSKTPMIKIQHPEYEVWINGTHGSAGVSCADCHMPYMRLDGKKKVSSHLWTSPLRNDEMIDNACRQCHTDKTTAYLRGRVENTQKKTFAQLLLAQELSVKAHEAVRQASEWTGDKAPDYDALMAQAREYVRKGQFFWDYVSAENSVGFHNPVKSLETLAYSQQYSQQAVNAASAATEYGIAKTLEGDIRALVPPLLEWSRAMQMEPDNLAKHVWTRSLKPLAKAEMMWDGLEKKRPVSQSAIATEPAPVVQTAQ